MRSSRRRRAQFLEFLQARAARAAEALYILGDLFETWVGDDDEDPYRSRICAALAQLAGRRRALLRHARQSGLPAAAGLRAAQRRAPDRRSAADRSVWRAGAAHAWRCAVHRRPLLPAAARHRAQSALAAALPAPAAGGAPQPGRAGARRQPPAHRQAPPPRSWMSTQHRRRRGHARLRRAQPDPRSHTSPGGARVRARWRAGAAHRARRLARSAAAASPGGRNGLQAGTAAACSGPE